MGLSGGRSIALLRQGAVTGAFLRCSLAIPSLTSAAVAEQVLPAVCSAAREAMAPVGVWNFLGPHIHRRAGWSGALQFAGPVRQHALVRTSTGSSESGPDTLFRGLCFPAKVVVGSPEGFGQGRCTTIRPDCWA
jgi:hypothetical protein